MCLSQGLSDRMPRKSFSLACGKHLAREPDCRTEAMDEQGKGFKFRGWIRNEALCVLLANAPSILQEGWVFLWIAARGTFPFCTEILAGASCTALGPPGCQEGFADGLWFEYSGHQ